MREKSEIDREFEEHEREQFAEQARMYRELTDEERLAIFFEDCEVRFDVPLEIATRVRAVLDRERDALFERLADALG